SASPCLRYTACDSATLSPATACEMTSRASGAAALPGPAAAPWPANLRLRPSCPGPALALYLPHLPRAASESGEPATSSQSPRNCGAGSARSMDQGAITSLLYITHHTAEEGDDSSLTLLRSKGDLPGTTGHLVLVTEAASAPRHSAATERASSVVHGAMAFPKLTTSEFAYQTHHRGEAHLAVCCCLLEARRDVSALVSGVVGALVGALLLAGGAAAGFVPHPHHHPGPLTINVFRWLAAFPPPVLHRALLLTQGQHLPPPALHPLPVHHPVAHHPVAHHPVVHSLPPPPPPVLPPPPPPLLPAVVKTPAVAAPPPAPLHPVPLGFPTSFNFPAEALPFAPGLLHTAGFFPLSARGLGLGPLGLGPLPFPTLKTPLGLPPLPPHATPAPLPPINFNPNLFSHGITPNSLLPAPTLFPGAFPNGAFFPGPGGPGSAGGPALAPTDFDFGLGAPGRPVQPTPSPPLPVAAPAPSPTPTPASFTALHDGHHAHYRQFFPAVNGITRATAGNLVL
ncbi:Protein piccolo, partial [Frankliniella fusca]